MHQDNLSHTLTVRVSPVLRDELADAAAREDITTGEFVRRAVRVELDGAAGRHLDPYADIPFSEKEAHLIEAIRAIGDAEATEHLIGQVGDHLVDLLDIGFQTLGVLHDETAYQRFERASGYLRQGSEALLLAASRVRALRANQLIASGELERIEARLSGEGA